MPPLDKTKIENAILKFARDHGLQIHPGQDAAHWADLVIKHGGGCLCIRGRTVCPCEFVLADIEEGGRCKCGLFANDAFVEDYHRTIQAVRQRKRGNPSPEPVEGMRVMGPKARSEFLKKISVNGFSIEEHDNQLTLRPRGAEATAAVTIAELPDGGWRATMATGTYAGFTRGTKRKFFEGNLNRWVAEALLQAPE